VLGSILSADPKFNLPQSDRYILFGEFCIDQAAERVFRGEAQLDISGKSYAILIVLVKKSGRIVTREEIKQALWPADSNIDVASNINTSIHNLRQMLGDSPSEAIYIETIPRKGYIFNAIPQFSSKGIRQSTNLVHDDSTEKRIVDEDTESSRQKSSWISPRWITMIFVLAGILLLGAGMATWVSHVGARFSH
jgi:DNA-binding winged helix-turn-helix (wHTH) protein